jgi:hypothetical protein
MKRCTTQRGEECALPQTLRLGVVYDFRNPPDSGMETPRLYAEILDQVACGDLGDATEHAGGTDASEPGALRIRHRASKQS